MGWGALAFIQPFTEGSPVYNSINFSIGLLGGPSQNYEYWPQNSTSYSTSIAALQCPSDGYNTAVIGPASYPFQAASYLAISGAGETIDGIPGNGAKSTGVFFTNSWVKLSAITDGTSNTIAFSESLRGPGSQGYEVPAGTSNDVKRFLNNAGDGMNCDAPVAQSAIKMGSWFAGSYEDGVSGNAALQPNSKVMDCTIHSTHAIHRSARSEHPGGVNVAFVDGHVAFVKDTVNLLTWRALATRARGEVISADAY